MSYVIGTAGHVDHGKSTLVEALTGIDPDRLAEEKRRGMTIDLGFAHFDLPEVGRVAIVDVPGHQRFVHNMLAGVHGLDAVLLVIAADEGVMPQTVEHLEIVTLFGVRRGVVALTKTDVVDAEWLELVTAETAEKLRGTTLAGAEIVPVSAVRNEGLDALRQQLVDVLRDASRRPDRGRPRLPVDRVFTVAGFGTVVTGTLVDGVLKNGDELQLEPDGTRVRVRGLEQQNARVEVAEPGTRTAVNLGGFERAQIERGDVLTARGLIRPTKRLDAQLTLLESARALKHNTDVVVHTGTAEAHARVVVLGGDVVEPAQTAFVQLFLARPIAAVNGDRFVLRLPSPAQTIGGGVFVDVLARRHARHDAAVVRSLERRLSGAGVEEELRKHLRGISEEALKSLTALDGNVLDGIEYVRAGDLLFGPDAWSELVCRARAAVDQFHAQHPLLGGMPREELRGQLRLDQRAFGGVLERMREEGAVELTDGRVSIPGRVSGNGTSASAGRLLHILGSEPLAPPSLPEAMKEAGAGPEELKALLQSGALIRVSPEVAFSRGGYESALSLVRELATSEGSVTVARLRDRMGASRRPVLALLEHLDGERVTRRVGDARVLRQR